MTIKEEISALQERLQQDLMDMIVREIVLMTGQPNTLQIWFGNRREIIKALSLWMARLKIDHEMSRGRKAISLPNGSRIALCGCLSEMRGTSPDRVFIDGVIVFGEPLAEIQARLHSKQGELVTVPFGHFC